MGVEGTRKDRKDAGKIYKTDIRSGRENARIYDKGGCIEEEAERESSN